MSNSPGAEVEAAPEIPKPSLLRLFNNATVYGVGQVVTSIIGFVTSPILSYLLTRADFGLLGVTRSISGMLTSFYRLGLDGAANRFHYDVEHDRAAMRRTVGSLNAFMLVWLVLLTAGLELLGPPLYDRLADGLPYAIYGRFIAYGALCDGLTAIPHALWGAQEKAKRIVGLRVATTLLSQTLTLTLLLTTKLGVMAVFWAGIVTPTLMLSVYLRYAYGTFGFAWDGRAIKQALAFGLPMVVHLSSHWILDAADRLMLDAYLGREAVGLYTAAYGSVGSLIMINMSVNSAFAPQFTRAHGDPAQREFVRKAVTWFLAAAAAASFAFMSLSGTMIRLVYSAKFAESARLVPILCISTFFQAVYLIYVNGLFHSKRTRIIPVGTVIAGAANVGLNALLIPRFGILGAAWATLAGYATLAFVFGVGCKWVTKIPFDRKRLVQLLVPIGALAALSWAIDGVFPVFVEAPLKVAIVVAGWPALSASGFIGDEERAWVRGRLAAYRAKIRWPRRRQGPEAPK